MKKLGNWLWRRCLLPVLDYLCWVGIYALTVALVAVGWLLFGWVITLITVVNNVFVIPYHRRRIIRRLVSTFCEEDLVATLRLYHQYEHGLRDDWMVSRLRLGALAMLASQREWQVNSALNKATSAEEYSEIIDQCYFGEGVRLSGIEVKALEKMLVYLRDNLARATTLEELERIQGLLKKHHSAEWKAAQLECASRIRLA